MPARLTDCEQTDHGFPLFTFVLFVVQGFRNVAPFTKLTSTSKIDVPVRRGPKLIFGHAKHGFEKEKRSLMVVATGELIRAMNYVEDITATLRRICIYIPAMSPEERKRLAESLRGAATQVNAAIADLEKVEK
jgi:hypothetical protein